MIWVGINSMHRIWQSGEGVDRAIAESAEVARQVRELLSDRAINSIPSEVHVLTLPPLQIVPDDSWRGASATAAIQTLTEAFNEHLMKSIRELNSQSAFVHDVSSLWRRVHSNPESYGFTHVQTPCLSSSPCNAPNQYVYYDSLHPTARMHTIIGEWVLSVLPQVSAKNKRKTAY